MAKSVRAGYELPLLLLGAFRSLINEMHSSLATSGHGEARPVHGFALQAIGPDGTTTSELARRLGVSKQAAGKTVASLERVGYVQREPDPDDGRAFRLRRTVRGEEMLSLSAALFESSHARLVRAFGRQRLAELEDDLQQIGGPPWDSVRGLPGWIA